MQKTENVTVTGKLKDGSLKMPDFESKITSVKFVWIQKLFDGSEQAWKQVLQVTAGVNEIM